MNLTRNIIHGRRKPLILPRTHANHETNEENLLLALGNIVIATSYNIPSSHGDELVQLKVEAAIKITIIYCKMT